MSRSDFRFVPGPSKGTPGKERGGSEERKKKEVSPEALAASRPSWSQRSSCAGVVGYLMVRPGCPLGRALVAELAARERAFPGIRPVGVVDIGWLRRGVEPGLAEIAPALLVYREGREIARSVGRNAIDGFIDALFDMAFALHEPDDDSAA